MPAFQGIDDDGSGFGVKGTSAAGAGVVGDGPGYAGVVASSVTGSGVSTFSDSGAGVLSLSNSGPGVSGRSQTGVGVSGESDQAAGVVAASVAGAGVSSFSDAGPGVLSVSNHGPGVSGQSIADAGVIGRSDAADGVSGSSDRGIGVNGRSGTDNGVLGTAEASDRAGVFGRNTAEQGGNGVTGLAEGLGGVGVFGSADRRGVGVVGEGATGMVARGDSGPGLNASSQQGPGVFATATRDTVPAIVGRSEGGTGVLGQAATQVEPAVHGEHERAGTGVLGTTDGRWGSAPAVAGVKGVSTADAAGVIGDSAQGTGVVGQQGGVSAVILPRAGVTGASSAEPGVFGWGSPGVFGLGRSDKQGVLAMGGLGSLGTTTLPAGGFLGKVTVLGDLKVAGGSKQFVIDHPLDPERRYLQHAAVEAPALKTFYDGTATLDDSGRARVELPEWFGSLNTGLCYQLTTVGSPAPDLHVAQEYDGSGFTVAGGRPGGRVCWQVTGVRQDRSARANPLVVEADKEPKNVGRYADPAAFDRGPEQHLSWAADLLALRDALPRVEEP